MALKRQPKYKKTNEDDPWITKTWNTPRGRASLKLAIYGLFIIFVFLLIIFRGSSQQQVYKVSYSSLKDTVSLSTKLSNLKENNFAFKYTIVINGNTTIFSGKRNKNIESGYKEDVNGITKYLKENDTFYKVGLSSKEPTTNIYEGFNGNYLNITFLLNSLESLKPIENDNVYIYNLDNGAVVTITTSRIYVKEIMIKENEATYTLEFSDIGEIENVDND